MVLLRERSERTRMMDPDERSWVVVSRCARFLKKRLASIQLWLSAMRAVPPWNRGLGPVRGRFLVTGASGVGKSTVAAVLSTCGYHAIDADERLAYAVSRADGSKVDLLHHANRDWFNECSWIWDQQKMEKLLNDSGDQALFICGNADNEAEFHVFFDAIFWLYVSESTLRRRLLKRSKKDPTRHPGYISKALLENRNMKRKAQDDPYWIAVDSEQGLSETVRSILSWSAQRGGPGDPRTPRNYKTV